MTILRQLQTCTRDTVETIVEKAGLSCWISSPARGEDIRDVISLFKPEAPGKELIRVGGEFDGGYLIPNDLEGITDCFSPGVDVKASFEKNLQQYGIRCHLADRSVEGPPSYLTNATFRPKFVTSRVSDETITLKQWIAETGLSSSQNLLLQMDIEGSEYEVLAAESMETLKQFRIIVLELHYLERMSNRVFLGILKALLTKLQTEFMIVHLHPNNCTQPKKVSGIAIPPQLEVTLLRRDRSVPCSEMSAIPHPLDRKNVPEKPDYQLTEPWLPTK